MALSAFDDKSKEPQAGELKIMLGRTSAPRYAEGRGVLIEVRNKKDLEAVKELAAVKMAN